MGPHGPVLAGCPDRQLRQVLADVYIVALQRRFSGAVQKLYTGGLHPGQVQALGGAGQGDDHFIIAGGVQGHAALAQPEGRGFAQDLHGNGDIDRHIAAIHQDAGLHIAGEVLVYRLSQAQSGGLPLLLLPAHRKVSRVYGLDLRHPSAGKQDLFLRLVIPAVQRHRLGLHHRLLLLNGELHRLRGQLPVSHPEGEGHTVAALQASQGIGLVLEVVGFGVQQQGMVILDIYPEEGPDHRVRAVGKAGAFDEPRHILGLLGVQGLDILNIGGGFPVLVGQENGDLRGLVVIQVPGHGGVHQGDALGLGVLRHQVHPDLHGDPLIHGLRHKGNIPDFWALEVQVLPGGDDPVALALFTLGQGQLRRKVLTPDVDIGLLPGGGEEPQVHTLSGPEGKIIAVGPDLKRIVAVKLDNGLFLVSW